MTTVPPPPPPAPPVPVATAGRSTNGMAVASLVLGITSVFCFGLIFPVPLLAVIFGHVSLDAIARSGGWQQGRGLAIAGAVLGWIFLVPIVIASLAWLGYGISNL